MRIFYFLLFFVISLDHLNAQCTVSADAGPDMTFCAPAPSVQLNGFIPGNPTSVSWSPATGLSDPSILNPTATVTTTTTYTLTGTVRSNNLVVNGDFEGGNSGFYTDYVLGTTSCFGLGFLDCEGTYGILTNPQDGHANFSPCSDVVGGGNMMVVNGAASLQNVWCQSITVTPNTNYDFSAWLASVSPASPAILQFSINGFPIGPLFNAGAPCDWGQFSTTWNSMGNTTATICILNQNTSAGGNDFALDGISFSAICEVEEDEVTIHVVDLVPTINPAGEIDCNDPNSCLFLDSDVTTNGTNLTYQWTASGGGTIQGGADTPFPLVCSAGTYTLEVSAELNGVVCTENVSIDIFDNGADPPNPSISGPDEVCTGDQSTYSVFDDPAFADYQWIVISGGTIVLGQGTPEVTIEWDDPENAELCLQVSNVCNNIAVDCYTISGAGPPPVPVLAGPLAICASDSIGSYYAVDLDTTLLDSIHWVVPVDAFILNGQGTDSLTVNWANSAGGTVCLTIGNNCADTNTCMVVNRVPEINSNFDTLICEGSTFIYNGTTYGNGNLSGQEMFTSLAGCDSIVTISVTERLPDLTELHATSCDSSELGIAQLLLTNSVGCDSLIIITTTYALSDTTEVLLTSCDPSEVGTTQSLLTDAAGCDSLVITTTTLLRSDTTDMFLTSCDPSEVGTTQSVLTNAVGCDSLVITITTLLLGDMTALFMTSCDPREVGTTQALLTNAVGCDSLVITTTTLLLGDTTEVFLTNCDPNEVGTTESLLTNIDGCDSLVVTTTTFALSDTTEVFLTSCDSREVGITQSLLTNAGGCDSLVVTTTTLLRSDTTELFLTSCDPNEVGIIQSLLTNMVGCDSLVITTTTLLRSDTMDLFFTSCDPNEVGTTQSLLTNAAGCDSLVITTTTLLRSDTTDLFFTSCDPNEVGTMQSLLTNAVGCDSLVITTTTLLRSDIIDLFLTSCDPNQVGTTQSLLTNAVGCDSLVITTTTLLRSDTTELFFTSCDPSEVGITQSLLTNVVGCDSLVVTTTTLLRSDTTDLFLTSCDLNEVGVSQSLLTNAVGCDSLVITTITLLRSDTTDLFFTSCDPIEAGTTQSVLTNNVGCDSLVIKTTTLLRSDTTELYFTSCDPNNVGTTRSLLTNAVGCDSLILTITLLAPSDSCRFEVFLVGDTIRCNETEGSLKLVATNGPVPLNYQWEKVGAGTNPLGSGIISRQNEPFLIAGLEAGNYRVTVTNPNNPGFDVILDAQIVEVAPILLETQVLSDYNGAALSCPGADDGIAYVQVINGGTAPYTYHWSDGQIGEEVEGLSAGWYQVTITDSEECMAIDSVFIPSPESLSITPAISEILCFGNKDGVISLQDVEGGVAPYHYSLNGSPLQASPEFFNLAAGNYELMAADANGCTVTEVILINSPLPIIIDLGPDTTIQLGDDIILDAFTNVPITLIDSLIWTIDSCANCLEVRVAPLITTTYGISLIDLNGCNATDDITIQVEKERNVYIPNVFSPNNDGTNDRFLIFADKTVKQVNRFQVYGRWGEEVYTAFNFQPNDPQHGWDGLFKGEAMNPGVFVYWAEIEFIDGAVLLYKGDVTLVK